MDPFSLVSEALLLLGLHAALFGLPFYNLNSANTAFHALRILPRTHSLLRLLAGM